jgi:hypothetical protein
MDAHDMRMYEAIFALSLKTRLYFGNALELAVQEFEGTDLAACEVLRCPNLSHAAFAEFLYEDVVPDSGSYAGIDRHLRFRLPLSSIVLIEQV